MVARIRVTAMTFGVFSKKKRINSKTLIHCYSPTLNGLLYIWLRPTACLVYWLIDVMMADLPQSPGWKAGRELQHWRSPTGCARLVASDAKTFPQKLVLSPIYVDARLGIVALTISDHYFHLVPFDHWMATMLVYYSAAHYELWVRWVWRCSWAGRLTLTAPDQLPVAWRGQRRRQCVNLWMHGWMLCNISALSCQ